ncbi:RDD family protein [Chryseobacterium indologenes]|uniref:RDD domain-containing protein n=1 Tax=Chryseobacterium indologenes TaxID=253 RepID=A0A0N0ZVG1_CHRID|nr:RDD family protein [Chryseobacterium indologenes]KPE51988.1 hypothetical protein AOB46_07190 [Chryseobacterium indologenes]
MKKLFKIIEDNKASQGLRLANFIIDRIVIYILFFLYGTFSVLMYKVLNIDFFLNIADKLSTLSRFEDILITTTVYFLYLFCMEYFTKGRTIGKYITGTRVMSTDGTTPTLQEFFIRNISRLVPFDVLSFLGSNGWHDNWSDTRVVNIKKYTLDKQSKEEINSMGTKEIA